MSDQTFEELVGKATSYYVDKDKVRPSQTLAEEAVKVLLAWVGQNTQDDPDIKDTPKRVVKALMEMTEGYRQLPEDILRTTFDVHYDEIVIVKDITFVSLCSHHLQIIEGVAHVGYLPGKVVGLSKIPRLVDCFSRRLQVQERMTLEIAEAIEKYLEAKGVAVVVNATHACMSCRGVRKTGASMTTSAMLGVFRTKPSARQEFLSLIR